MHGISSTNRLESTLKGNILANDRKMADYKTEIYFLG